MDLVKNRINLMRQGIGEIHAIRENYRLFKGGLVQQTDLWSRSSLAAYEVGKLDFGTMIDAHVRRLRFELQVEKFRFQIYQRLADLEALTGTVPWDGKRPMLPEDKSPQGKQADLASRQHGHQSRAGVN